MSEPFSLFDHEQSAEPESSMMTERQRESLRAVFAALGLRTAREQFELVEILTGRRIKSPLDLSAPEAQALLVQLRHRAEQSGRSRTGSSWDDREEDTWIDRL